MNRIARFEKVSLDQFRKDLSMDDAEELYEEIVLPQRATKGSAGYDFSMPFPLVLQPHETAKIPTGIRCRMEQGWVLMIFPRSSLGFKYKLQLDNTVGIIDADYYEADNEGHIQIKITNHSDKVLTLNQHDRFAQGIFLPYGITEDDSADRQRVGGFGSTDSSDVVITRRSNPTTGYNWEVVNHSDLLEVDSCYVADKHPQGMTGSGGETVFTLRPLKAGSGSFRLLYKRKWEDEAINEETVEFTVDGELHVHTR